MDGLANRSVCQVEDQKANFVQDEEQLSTFMTTTCDQIASSTDNEEHVGLAPPSPSLAIHPTRAGKETMHRAEMGGGAGLRQGAGRGAFACECSIGF